MNKRLLFYIPTLEGGGAERVLLNLIAKLDKERFDIHLCVLSNRISLYKDIPDKVEHTILFKSKSAWFIARFYQKYLKSDFIFKKQIQYRLNLDYDSVICFMDGEFTSLLDYFPLSKKITWVHSSYTDNPKYRKKISVIGLKKMKRSYNKLDHIIFVSHQTRIDFSKVFGEYENMSVIYNIIYNEKLRYAINNQNKTKPTNNIFTFIAVGRLIPIKGFDRLIRVAKKLKDNNYIFNIKILGSGIAYHNLAQMITNYCLEQYVELLLFKKNPYEYMYNADAFVLSSIVEGLPTAMCEAFILGLPVITTKCSGATELVENGKYGLMAEQDDESLFIAMKSFMDDHSLYEKFACRSKERALIFKEKDVLNKIEKIL